MKAFLVILVLFTSAVLSAESLRCLGESGARRCADAKKPAVNRNLQAEPVRDLKALHQDGQVPSRVLKTLGNLAKKHKARFAKMEDADNKGFNYLLVYITKNDKNNGKHTKSSKKAVSKKTKNAIQKKVLKKLAKKTDKKKASVKKAAAKKAPVKKALVKKAPVKKAPVKKALVKKAPVKKAPIKKLTK